MNIAGIICEYNPFHAGHAYHIRMTREMGGADAVIAVMSTCFTQRGEISCLPVDARVRMALASGADLVFALPCAFSLSDAQHFARAGVWLLGKLGCKVLSFGAESADTEKLKYAARFLQHLPATVQESLKDGLSRGLSWPRAQAEAVAAYPEIAGLIASPNNILALSYLQAMEALSLPMEPCIVPRLGAYHDTSLSGPLPSASAVRSALQRGDYAAVKKACPDGFWLIREACAAGLCPPPSALDQVLLHTLRTLPLPDAGRYRDAAEGVPALLKKCASSAASREELLKLAVSSRYPRARLSRLMSRLLLDLPDAVCETFPRHAWLLGYRKDAEPVLREAAQHAEKNGVTVSGSAAAIKDSWLDAEIRAWDLYALAVHQPSGSALRHRVIQEMASRNGPRSMP